jgi:diguanylate cyclase (GGDEF)-like protein
MVVDSSLPGTAPVEEREPAHSLPESTQRRARSLPQVLGTRDLTALMVLTVVFVANINGVQAGGPTAFIYWILGFLTFMIPVAYVTRWLAQRYAGEAARYVWATRILGSNWVFLVTICSVGPGVLALVSAIDASLILVQYLAPAWLTTPTQQGLATVTLIVAATAVNFVPLRWLKHGLVALTALYVGVLLLLGGLGIWWLLSGHRAATALNVTGAWQPNGNNVNLFGVVILALLGTDVPLFMGGEIRGGRAGARRALSSIWWGTAIAAAAYLAGTFGVMVIVPPAQAGAVSADAQVISMIFGSAAGTATAIFLAISQWGIAIAYILMFSRIWIVVAGDHHLPARMAKINRHGIPYHSVITLAFYAILVATASYILIPDITSTLVDPTVLSSDIYNLLQAEGSVLWIFASVLLFVLALWLALPHRRAGVISAGQRRVLLGMSCVGFLASGIGMWDTIIASWVPAQIDNGHWSAIVGLSALVLVGMGWFASEVPHVRAKLAEQQRRNEREKALNSRLQEANTQQQELNRRLQEANAQQQELNQQLQEANSQQKELLLELDRLYHEQARAAITDAVTGLPNHRAVMSRLDEEIARCQRSQGAFAIVFVDLDHFKQVNDTWGHRAGDAILREVASRLSTGVRAEDFVGRYGGEEFAIILTDADVVSAGEATERLRQSLNARPCYWESEDTQAVVPVEISGSFGVAIYKLHGIKREELIECADQAMYAAKRGGRNRVCIADVERAYIEESIQPSGSEARENERHIQESVGMRALTAVAAARDGSTWIHANRLVDLAVATARKLGQSEGDLHLLRLGAILHDIGKIGIPDAILHKPGPLTDEEWAVMRTHPDIGRQILEEIDGIFQHLATIVVAHHERWDGKGYPNRLEGEAIPLAARILTVVDSYDAMVSHRVYREPLTTEQARAELLRCSGTQFDPNVVQAFLEVLDEQASDALEQEAVVLA